MKYLKRSILTLAIAVIPFHSYVNGCGGDFYDYMNSLEKSRNSPAPLPAALSTLPLYLTILPCHLYSTATSHCSLSLLIF